MRVHTVSDNQQAAAGVSRTKTTMRSTTLAHFGTNSQMNGRKDASENYISNSNASMHACTMDKVGGAAKLYNTYSPKGTRHEQEANFLLKNVMTSYVKQAEDNSFKNLKVQQFNIEKLDDEEEKARMHEDDIFDVSNEADQ